MIVPPSAGDWTARVDPTKLRNRKFNTGKSAKTAAAGGGGGPNQVDNAIWLETPEQKRQRLADEVMGVQRKVGRKGPEAAEAGPSKEDEIAARRIREYNVSISLHWLCPCGKRADFSD